MTDQQRRECPDIYRRLKLLSLRAGEALEDRRVWRDEPISRMALFTALPAQKDGFDAIKVSEAINDDLEPFMGVLE